MSIIKRDGKVISTTKNLRGLLDYARKSPVVQVRAERDGKVRGNITVNYADGCVGVDSFASYHIMVDWVRNRRSWRGASTQMTEDIGYLTKPGIIAGM